MTSNKNNRTWVESTIYENTGPKIGKNEGQF